MNVVFSGDQNLIKKETDKILKYADITIGIECMWNVKTEMKPVITGKLKLFKVIQKIL